MDFLPAKLNFLKQVELFITLERYNKQFREQMAVFDKQIKQKAANEPTKNFTFPTWNVEKKILGWTYLNHKHFGTAIGVDIATDERYQKDWKTNKIETTLAGERQTLENLAERGFGRISQNPTSVTINETGREVGEIIFKSYAFRQVKYGGEPVPWDLLEPIWYKKVGYHCLYYSTWFIIIITLFFVSSQLLINVGLMDNTVRFFREHWGGLWDSLIYIITLAPIVLFLIGFFIISYNKKGQTSISGIDE